MTSPIKRDYDTICENKGINMNWLLTGEGGMMLKDVEAGVGNQHYEEIGRLAEALIKKVMER